MNIPNQKDPTTCKIDGSQGVNFTEDPGINPGAKEPSGEKAVNKQEPERNSGGYPAKGSGY